MSDLMRGQMIRAEEKSWEMFEWMKRILVCSCHADVNSAVDADPEVFRDGFALVNYITGGEARKRRDENGRVRDS